ncbi:hypothetical protein [Leifsonia sp. Root227]|uniref:hypothetical protein n=1 Tax=Leifsonia sp. Root227 TaxID=1736496 RepID=UPI0012F9D073|nr:hypothetical protein [Leifsonia sp. Root227]
MKTTEVRRRFLPAPWSIMLIYSSTPERAVVGHVRVRSVQRMTADALWSSRGDRTLLSRAELDSYAGDRTTLHAIDVEDPVTWATPIPLTMMRAMFGFNPPQNVARLSTEIAKKMIAIGNGY